jgi:hypothetical protein
MALPKNTADVIHIRAHEAEAAGQFPLAGDLRIAIETLQKLERERVFARRPMAQGRVSTEQDRAPH